MNDLCKINNVNIYTCMWFTLGKLYVPVHSYEWKAPAKYQ